MRRLFVALLVAVVALPVQGEDLKTILAAKARAYRQDLEKLEADARKSAEAWPDQYLQALMTLEQRFQQAGDLDSVIVVRREKARFSEGKQLPEEAVVQTPREVAALQTKAIRMLKNIEDNRGRQAGAATERYLAGLEEMKRSLTKQGQFEDALKVSEEIGRVRKEAEAAGIQLVSNDATAPRPPEQKKPEVRKPAAEAKPVFKPAGSRKKGRSPIGTWLTHPEGMPDVSLIVVLHKDGRWEAVDDQVWNGRFKFLNDEQTKMERRSNGQVFILEYDPETDQMIQDGQVPYFRVKK